MLQGPTRDSPDFREGDHGHVQAPRSGPRGDSAIALQHPDRGRLRPPGQAVTTQRADLNGTILSLLGVDVSATALPLASLSAVSYRAVGREEEPQQLQMWPAPLALAQPLPTLPLWITPEFSVPLDLEASYQMTCADLRIRQAE
jgi:hypothetical protein